MSAFHKIFGHGALFVGLGLSLALVSCGGGEELSEEDIAFQKKAQENAIVEKTKLVPGGDPYEKGTHGGAWQASINNDPKTFNTLTARDGDSRDIIDPLYDALLDYDPYKKEWKANAASYEVIENKEVGTLDMIFTLRDDLYWTTLAEPGKKVKITSDDVVFWYDEIDGDKALQLPAYPGQFLDMPDGSKKRIEIEKIDERSFKLKYPGIIAMPELHSNMEFGPRYVFEPVKKAQGVEGVLNLWSVDTDPKTIPSMGPYHIASYRPGIEVTLTRNADYWKSDDFGQKLPYIETISYKIIPNVETEKLKFLAGEKDSFTVRPEDLDQMVNQDPKDYSVYYAGPNLGAGFIAWNQNPNNLAPKYYKWFSQTKFRQAMASFFNRERVIKDVYRGLAEPALHFFAKPNPYFDPDIKQRFDYDPQRGLALLAEIGIKPDAQGKLRDAEGNLIEFDLSLGSENNVNIDIANIYADELKKVGVTLNVKPVDFQKLVDSLVNTYDWQSAMVALGSNYWPTSGSNVWQSNGNFHLWYPLQEKAATPWEKRVDELYNLGSVTRDPVAAKKIWDEFQTILLDEVPLLYMVHPDGFQAYRDKWANVRVDNLGSPDANYFYLK